MDMGGLNEYFKSMIDKQFAIRDVLQKHFAPKKLSPIAKWQAERESLNADLKRLNLECNYITIKCYLHT